MNRITTRIKYIAASGSMTILIALFCINSYDMTIYPTRIWLVSIFFILLSMGLLGFLIHEILKLRIARMIVENNIIHIQAATSESTNGQEETIPTVYLEMFISCFGVLLDSKIIKFNINNIKLKGVNIGKEYIMLSYGIDNNTKRIKIIHSALSKEEINHIAEIFCYETGITPTIE
ncbi:hypothetical protein JR334_07310 [Clostridia bacterium]|nr:hypothetical protein JR334_07310 [Clostridia bacterium]